MLSIEKGMERKVKISATIKDYIFVNILDLWTKVVLKPETIGKQSNEFNEFYTRQGGRDLALDLVPTREGGLK